MVEIKNLNKAAKKIKEAILSNKNIIIFADSDLDGASSAIILKEAIENFSLIKTKDKVLPKIDFYFPSRIKEGYGLNKSALSYLKKKFLFSGKNKKKPLIITLDCGIGNFKEVDLARKIGFDVLIIDHHEVLKKTPKANLIVDPKQKGDKYPFKEFSNAGLTFKLAQEILKGNLSKALEKNFLELVALATIADMMPQVGENKLLINAGLKDIDNSPRPGIKAFFEILDKDSFSTKNEMIRQIVSALNTSTVENHIHLAFSLLTAINLEEAKDMAKDLLEKNKIRHQNIKLLEKEIKEKVLKSQKKSPIVFLGSSSFPLELLGSVASMICKEFQKPVFLFQIQSSVVQGVVRVPSGFDGVKLMEKCSKLLKTYGGHPKAAGFSVKQENLDKFKGCLIKQLITSK